MVGEEKVFKLTEVEKHNISKGENKECFQKKYSIIYKDNSMNWFLCIGMIYNNEDSVFNDLLMHSKVFLYFFSCMRMNLMHPLLQTTITRLKISLKPSNLVNTRVCGVTYSTSVRR